METRIRTIIADDEVIAREVLKNFLNRYCPDVIIVDEAVDCRDAAEKILSHKPDLVFLDVEMPFGNAFDVLDACKSHQFDTVFVTAYADYAVHAFNYSASYYILKPVSIEQLIAAVNKVKSNFQLQSSLDKNKVLLENNQEKSSYKRQLVLPTMEGYDIVKPETIIRLQGNGNFTDIYFTDQPKKMVCRVLKFFEEILPPAFVRVHKSHIVNTEFITSFNKAGGGYLVMKDKSEVEVSNMYKEALLKALNI